MQNREYGNIGGRIFPGTVAFGIATRAVRKHETAVNMLAARQKGTRGLVKTCGYDTVIKHGRLGNLYQKCRLSLLEKTDQWGFSIASLGHWRIHFDELFLFRCQQPADATAWC